MEHEDKGDNEGTDYVTPDKERMPWAALDLVLEFKNKFPLLFVQLTTYARAMFAVRPYRYFVSTLAFQQVKRYVTFIFFHRGGSVLSHDLYLTTKTGFSTFVRHLCGMLSWSFANAGMESSRSLRYHFLRVNGRCVVLEVKNILQNRTCVRGRATRVEKVGRLVITDSVKAARVSALKHSNKNLPTHLDSTPTRTRVLRSHTRAPQQDQMPPVTEEVQQVSSEPLHISPPAEETLLPDLLHSKLDIHEQYIIKHSCFLRLSLVDSAQAVPDTLVCKDSWSYGLTPSPDVEVFSQLRGCFGVPTLYGYTKVNDNQAFLSKELDLRAPTFYPGASIYDLKAHFRGHTMQQWRKICLRQKSQLSLFALFFMPCLVNTFCGFILL